MTYNRYHRIHRNIATSNPDYQYYQENRCENYMRETPFHMENRQRNNSINTNDQNIFDTLCLQNLYLKICRQPMDIQRK